ncbi:MAG: excinuclease ABC subunit UvrC [Elusimicrobia bacterium]|nr:excinuclease ABC subunit UvrC [Elusimicrobiota bacterium]MDE2426552.1 excinuclease ABC subunit UvrC [Elusimicrobiota bacterium]
MTAFVDRSHLPHACGVYIMRDEAGKILYIGKAIDLAKRVSHYFAPRKGPADYKNSILAPLVRKIDYIACASEREALLLEQRLIKRHRPFFNVTLKDDKAYPYVKVTLGEDFPRVLLARRKLKDKAAYFGPFPNVTPVRRLLKDLWRRRFFRLRPCRWEFSMERPLEARKINSCLYYHTGECPAPCAGLVSFEGYRGYAGDVLAFFRGDYADLAERFRREMAEASLSLDYERAAQLRDNIAAIAQMGERARVEAVSEAGVAGRLKASQAVTDLQKALGLAAPPFHIECFDISHFQGRQTVASMVCFKAGVPNKDEYRRFRVRAVAGIDDFASLSEVVGRRYARLKAEGSRLPDLILIDGGKGQLHAAQAALKSVGADAPVASLAKRIEEVFLPGRTNSLLLARDRPALRLLQHLRDEAHRFGLAYHRLLRGKALLG